jgi:hypothetical protein
MLFKQLIMSNQDQPAIPPPTTVMNRLPDYVDLVLTLAEIMKDMQAYGSLAALSSVNREYHEMLQPFIKRTKKRIVLKMSKLEFLPQDRFKDIEYVKGMPHDEVLSWCILTLSRSESSNVPPKVFCPPPTR